MTSYGRFIRASLPQRIKQSTSKLSMTEFYFCRWHSYKVTHWISRGKSKVLLRISGKVNYKNPQLLPVPGRLPSELCLITMPPFTHTWKWSKPKGRTLQRHCSSSVRWNNHLQLLWIIWFTISTYLCFICLNILYVICYMCWIVVGCAIWHLGLLLFSGTADKKHMKKGTMNTT